MRKICLTFSLFFAFTGLIAQVHQPGCGHIRHFLVSENEPAGVPGVEEYDAGFVKLDLSLSHTSNAVSGNAYMEARAVSALTQCVLELHNNLTVDSVYFNGIRRTYTHNSGVLKIFAPSAIPAGSNFSVRVFYHGNPPNGGFFNGFSNAASPTWGNTVTWSLSEPNNAFQWWPCKQVLTDKLDSTRIWITVDSGVKAGSNGVLERITTLGNKRRFEWNYPAPIAYYLLSVAVARYVEYNFNVNIPGIQKPVLVQNFIYDNPGTLSMFKSEIDKTADMLKVFSGMFGPYPFASMKYGHCMAPFSGGMEHNTMTTQGTFNTTLTAHELGHQWWGDHVTCKSWKDIWINEGFARYSEYLYLSSYSAAQSRTKIDDLNRSVLSQPGGSVYVTDTVNPSAIFNGRLTYDKGALVIHMIRFVLSNDSLFYRILKKFQEKYANANAGVSEFKALLEVESGTDFTVFFNQWYYGQGYPEFHIRYNYDQGYAIVKIRQKVSAPGATPLFVTPLELRLKRNTGDTLIRLLVHSDSQTYQIPMSTSITGVETDPLQWILNDTGTVVSDTTLKYYFNHVQEKDHASGIKLFPNPAGNQLYVFPVKTSGEFSIYNASGQCIRSGFLKQGDPVDLVNVPAGHYILLYQGHGIRFIRK